MQTSASTLARVGVWMMLAIASFAAMAVAAREMAGRIPVFEMLTLRSAIGLLIVIAIMLATRRSFASSRPPLQVARNVVHFAGQYCWTVGVIALPLAEVFALEFTVPVWTALLGLVLFGERPSRARWVAVAGGFAGVLLVVRPGFAILDPMTLVVLAAAWCFAGSILMVKALTRSDGAMTILFYMTLVQLPLGLVLALPQWVAPVWAEAPWLVLFSVGGLTAHLGLAKALALADAAVVLPLDYLRLPMIALVGFALYGESLDLWVFAGAALIMASNYHSIRDETRRRRPLLDGRGS